MLQVNQVLTWLYLYDEEESGLGYSCARARLTVDRVVDPGPLVGQLHLVGLGISLLSDTVAENIEYTSKQISERVCLTDNLCEGYFSLIASLMKASTAWSTSVTSCAHVSYQFRLLAVCYATPTSMEFCLVSREDLLAKRLA